MTSEQTKIFLVFALIFAIAHALTFITAQLYIVPKFKALFRHL